MYTYTYRSDVHVYECFAGVIVSPNEAFIIEAGDNCQRGLQPLVKGMKLIKKSSCDDYTTNSPTKSSKVASTLNGTERPAFPAWWPSTTRKPWFKKSTTTTKPKNLWNDQQPKSSSKATKMFWNSFVLCFVFSLSLILR
ncbi:hypothetical protein Avbf_13664 [Armadillidium vulgare]|nr:hypothetical protein Avbf_13664 [Armadillidium vulgare]